MASSRGKLTAPQIKKRKSTGPKLAMLTAYDASFARLIDQAGADIILVGDSLGMVIQGGGTTLPVTMEEMIYHCRSVARGAERAQVVGDMPFMSYQASLEDGIRNAGRLVKEGGAEAVKLEGGAEYAELARRLTRIGIPVMGHLGLTPQSFHSLGGWKVQGRGQAAADKLVEDAKALDEAGCYGIVLEMIPTELAERITEAVSCPTIGIGAGPACDGQVLVIYDLLGMNEEFRPRFVKRYENLGVRIRTAVEEYVTEVRDGVFPDVEHGFSAEVPEAAAPYSAPRAAQASASSSSGRDPDAAGAACIPLPLPKRK